MPTLPRIYAPESMQDPVPELSGEDSHYLVHVLRKGKNDRCILFGNKNVEKICRVSEIRNMMVRLEVLEERTVETESPVDLTLAIATGKGKKLEQIVEATTALGIRRIAPFLAKRSVARRSNPRLVERLQLIALEACRQSGRTQPPEIRPPQKDLPTVLRESLPSESTIFSFDEQGGRELSQALEGWTPNSPVVLFCGPEGGWSEEERTALDEHGAVNVTLGPRILRTELAAVVAVGLVENLISARVSNPPRETEGSS